MCFPILLFFSVSHSVEKCYTSLGFPVCRQRRTGKHSSMAILCCYYWLCLLGLCLCTVLERVYACSRLRSRQGEGADLPRSDRCNDPTSDDLIRRGIARSGRVIVSKPERRLNSPQLFVTTRLEGSQQGEEEPGLGYFYLLFYFYFGLFTGFYCYYNFLSALNGKNGKIL